MRKKQEEARKKRYCFRLSEKESAYFEEQRSVTGLCVSEYTRRRVLGFRIVSKIDLKVINEIKKLGGLLKLIHNETHGIYSQYTVEAIQAITSYVRRLERAITNDCKSASCAAG